MRLFFYIFFGSTSLASLASAAVVTLDAFIGILADLKEWHAAD